MSMWYFSETKHVSQVDELEAFFELAESTVTYIVTGKNEGIKDDVLDLIEQVLQCWF